MYEVLKNHFDSLKELNTYHRIDDTHHLDVYVGFDEENKKSLAIVVEGNILDLESTKLIKTKVSRRKDDKLYISFNLQDDSMCDVFYKFCDDIIESTRNIKLIESLDFIMKRWKRWIELFTKTRTSLLSENEIRGLLGELIFLKENMFRKYHINRSIISWQGCEKAHKDFEIDDDWYEIKTIRQSGDAVIISSIEQLDDEKDGKLIVIRLESSNKEKSEYITLNKYVNEIKELIEEEEIKNIFLKKLNAIGYIYDDGYDEYVYVKKGSNYYNVNKQFPRLLKNDLKEGIGKISYEVYLDAINDFKTEV